MKKFAFALAAVAALFAGSRARADLVTSISGVDLSYYLSVPTSPGGVATLNLQPTLGNNFVTVINGTSGYFINTLFVNLTFDRPGTVTPQGTTYNFDPSTYANGETIQFADGSAKFNLTGLSILVPTNNPRDLLLSGTIQLASNASSTFDLSPFNNPASTFDVTLNTAPTDLPGFIATGAGGTMSKDGGSSTIVGTASFSESDPAATPEPSSLVLLGLGSLGMIGYSWRRRRLALA